MLGQTLSRACRSEAKVNGETFILPLYVAAPPACALRATNSFPPTSHTEASSPPALTATHVISHSYTTSHTLTHTHIAIYTCILSHTATFVHMQTHHFFPIQSQMCSHFPQEPSLCSISQTSVTINLTHWRSPKPPLLPFSADTCFDLLYQSNIAPYRDQRHCVFPGEPNL